MEKLKINKEVDINNGLTKEQAKERLAKGLKNTTYTKTTKTYSQIFIGNIFSWFNILCFTIAGVLIAVDSYNNLLFTIPFLCNLIICLIQEIRAKQTVDKINVINQAKVNAIRDGKAVEIELHNVLQDEVVFLKSGEQICADCVVIEGEIEVNESLLTGESKPIKKKNGDTLLGGSYIVNGQCKAMAVKIGLETYSSKLIKKAREVKDNQSDILKTLSFIIKTIGFVLIPLGALTFMDNFWHNGDIKLAIEKTAGSIIGMMPVGMFLLTSVSLVAGVLNLAKRKTLVQDLYSIEMLARADVLCLDKTGTLTDGTMSVAGIINLKKSANIKEIMQLYLSNTKTDNSTSIALAKYFEVQKEPTVIADKVAEFSSEKKYSAVQFDKTTYYLGAPEFITNKLSKDNEQIIKNLTNEGMRVVILCEYKGALKETCDKHNNIPIAIISIKDNIRPDVEQTIQWFKGNGVEIKIISGDNVHTVSTISRKVGISNYDKYISLENLTDEEVARAALNYNIFGRVTPEQKSIIIKSLKGNGHRVAMTGDGINDILALKEADCSIAMADGSEATRSASNLIMMENNFNAMPDIVKEGRRVINNIAKASSLFLTKTFFVMFLTIFCLISNTFEYPLQPVQILIWETLFIGVPAFFLALQNTNERINGSFIGSLSSKALPASLLLFLASIACYVYCAKTNQFVLIPTLISYCATFGAFFVLLYQCLPLNGYRSFVAFSMLALAIGGFVLASLPFKDAFGYLALSTSEFIFFGITLASVALFYPLLKLLFEHLFKFTRKNKTSTN